MTHIDCLAAQERATKRFRGWLCILMAVMVAAAMIVGWSLSQMVARDAIAAANATSRQEVARLEGINDRLLELFDRHLPTLLGQAAASVQEAKSASRTASGAAQTAARATDSARKAVEEVKDVLSAAPLAQPGQAEVPAWLDGP